MKNLKDIEKLSFEELERISDDKSINVPEGFAGRLENAVAGLASSEACEPANRGRGLRIFSLSAAGAALAAAVVVFAVSRNPAPKDTFDDPLLAYAQVEKSFSLISEKIGKGAEMVSVVPSAMNKPKEIIDKINRK